MDIRKSICEIPYGVIFEKQEFRNVVRNISPGYKEYSINWLLQQLKEENAIAAVGKGKYVRIKKGSVEKEIYSFPHSSEYLEIERSITEKFPLLTFQMWEFIQFNEFVNHQISKNIFMIEVEHMLEEAVFEFLRSRYSHVLFCPKVDEYFRYKGEEETLVVLKLVSEAPRAMNGHSSPLEKLLVDLFTGKLTGKLLQKSEYKAIFEDSFSKYRIDETKLFRYARRRNVEKEIRKFIKEQTDIVLITCRDIG